MKNHIVLFHAFLESCYHVRFQPSTRLRFTAYREWLMNVYLDGRLSISNNLAERSIRPFTIGRNNWLFAYSTKGAQSSAIAYSIVETALANNLVPMLYLQFLFEQL